MQLLRATTGCEVDLVRKRPRSCNRAQTLDTETTTGVLIIHRIAPLTRTSPCEGFPNRTRAARRRMLAIQRMTTMQRQAQQTGKYRELLGIAERVVECARSTLKDTSNARSKDLLSNSAAEELRTCELGDRVIAASKQEFPKPNSTRRIRTVLLHPTRVRIYPTSQAASRRLSGQCR